MNARPVLGSLIFEVTQRCNHACLHCYNVWQGQPRSTHPLYPRGELDTPKTLALLAKALDETGCRHVTLTGGEPLMRDDLLDIVDFISARNVRITLITNGRLLTEPMAASLIAHGVGLFELPLLSDHREMHDELSGSVGAWDAVLAAITNIRLHRGQVAAAFVATRRNIMHLYQTIRLAFAFGARAVMFNRFNAGGRGRLHLDELLPTVEQVRDALAVAESASVEFGIPVACSIPIQPCLIDTRAFPHLGFGFCAVGTERAYYTLDPLGNVRACNHSPAILGNLWDESFADLVAEDRLRHFAEALPPQCAPCSQRSLCQGGCKAAAESCYGSLHVAEPFLRGHIARTSTSLSPSGQ